MQRYLWLGTIAVLLTACAAPEQRAQKPSPSRVENLAFSSIGPSREGSDQACRAEATGFDAALSRRGDDRAIMDAFDAVAMCRKIEARRLAAAERNKAQAGAALIGLRGAMRRDVGRLRAALFNSGQVSAMNSRIARAEELENILLETGS